MVGAIAFGLDTRFLSKFSFLNTSKIEQKLLIQTSSSGPQDAALDTELAPELKGAVAWINSQPLTMDSLRGKVVLVDFWTYSCINCLRTLPYLRKWAEKYRDQGLVVIGVHSPEFAFEKLTDNVRTAVSQLRLTYPIAVDSDSKIWAAYKNRYWPAHYLIDTRGRVRFHHFGEGAYEESELQIQQLLRELAPSSTQLSSIGSSSVAISQRIEQPSAVEAPRSEAESKSSETYIGYKRQQGFVSEIEINKDVSTRYEIPLTLSLNDWSLSGLWNIQAEMAQSNSISGQLAFRFQARDLHLVMGAPVGEQISFRVTLDGKPPRESHGQDVDQDGNGKLTTHRLYQLIRVPLQKGQRPSEHTFRIEFFQSGAEVFSFTFG
jgi:thiol-disulfide isomerase/thioredoxin